LAVHSALEVDYRLYKDTSYSLLVLDTTTTIATVAKLGTYLQILDLLEILGSFTNHALLRIPKTLVLFTMRALARSYFLGKSTPQAGLSRRAAWSQIEI